MIRRFTGRTLKDAIAGVTDLVEELLGDLRGRVTHQDTDGASESESPERAGSTHSVATPPRSGTLSEPVASKDTGGVAKSPAAKKESSPKKRTTAKKAASAKSAAKKPAAKKSAAKKSAAKKPAAKKSATAKSAVKKPAANKATAKVKSTAETKPTGPGNTSSGELPVREGELNWLESELAGVRQELNDELAQMTEELTIIDKDLSGLLSEAVDSAGDDPVDSGTKAIEREQEIALAISVREMRDQVNHALTRLDDGTYGVCESCGEPIGKMRLQAFPRATLCMACKQREERR